MDERMDRKSLNQFGQRRLNRFKCFADRLFFPVGHLLTDVYLQFYIELDEFFVLSLSPYLSFFPHSFCIFFFHSSRWCVKSLRCDFFCYRDASSLSTGILFFHVKHTRFIRNAYLPEFFDQNTVRVATEDNSQTIRQQQQRKKRNKKKYADIAAHTNH